jgi:hypothetical protein
MLSLFHLHEVPVVLIGGLVFYGPFFLGKKGTNDSKWGKWIILVAKQVKIGNDCRRWRNITLYKQQTEK